MALDDWAKSWSAGLGSTGKDVASQYHDDAVRYDRELVSQGKEAIAALADAFLGAVPDAVLDIMTQIEQGSTVVIEWSWSGTHTGDLPGWPATGKRFRTTGCNVIELDGDLIREERSYWDWESLRSQA